MFKVFSIYDVRSDTYNVPFFFKATGEAVRAFKDLANDRNTMVARHSGDFKLVQVGTFDEATGELVSVSPVVSLGFGSDYLDVPSESPIQIPSIGKKVS